MLQLVSKQEDINSCIKTSLRYLTFSRIMKEATSSNGRHEANRVIRLGMKTFWKSLL